MRTLTPRRKGKTRRPQMAPSPTDPGTQEFLPQAANIPPLMSPRHEWPQPVLQHLWPWGQDSSLSHSSSHGRGSAGHSPPDSAIESEHGAQRCSGPVFLVIFIVTLECKITFFIVYVNPYAYLKCMYLCAYMYILHSLSFFFKAGHQLLNKTRSPESTVEV